MCGYASFNILISKDLTLNLPEIISANSFASSTNNDSSIIARSCCCFFAVIHGARLGCPEIKLYNRLTSECKYMWFRPAGSFDGR